MRFAILSDIHGNLEALKRTLSEIEHREVDEIAVLGDLVGYGPDPNDCIELCREATSNIIMGNHDKAAFHLEETYSFNLYAAKAAQWTAVQLAEDNKAFLESLPLIIPNRDILFVHASPLIPESWNYVLSKHDANINFSAFAQKFCFIGHSHIPGMFGKVSFRNECAGIVHLDENDRYIINVGSVGQPRDGNPKLAFGIFDDENLEFEWIRLNYNFNETARKIIDAKLPPYLAERLYHGL